MSIFVLGSGRNPNYMKHTCNAILGCYFFKEVTDLLNLLFMF